MQTQPRYGTRAYAVVAVLNSHSDGISFENAADAYAGAGRPVIGINRSTLNVLKRWGTKKNGRWYPKVPAARRVYKVGDRVQQTMPGYESVGTIDERLNDPSGLTSWGEGTDYWPVTWDDKNLGWKGKSGVQGMYLEPLAEEPAAPAEVKPTLLDQIKSKLATRAVVKRDGVGVFVAGDRVLYVGPVAYLYGQEGIVREVHSGPRYTVDWESVPSATTERESDLAAAPVAQSQKPEIIDAEFEEVSYDPKPIVLPTTLHQLPKAQPAVLVLDCADVSEESRELRRAIEDHRAAIPVIQKKISDLEIELEISLQHDADVAWAKAVLAGETDGRKLALLETLNKRQDEVHPDDIAAASDPDPEYYDDYPFYPEDDDDHPFDDDDDDL